jgi:hypothetical protein
MGAINASKSSRLAGIDSQQMGGRLINSTREKAGCLLGKVLKAVDDADFPCTKARYAKVAAEAKKKHKPARKARP